MRSFLAVLAVFYLVSGVQPVIAKDEVNADPKGIAIQGFDPVAYFVSGSPSRGSSAYTVEFNGATYQFSSAENRDTFKSAPSKYAPAYGGWCSYGVRVGRKFKVDPDAWNITDGRLFMQLDLGTQKIWMTEKDKNIEIADRLWPSIKTVPADALGN